MTRATGVLDKALTLAAAAFPSLDLPDFGVPNLSSNDLGVSSSAVCARGHL